MRLRGPRIDGLDACVAELSCVHRHDGEPAPAEQPVAVLAMVPPAVLPDDPVRIEEGPDGIGEVEAATLETDTVLGLVPFELHPRK